ncbi:MAG: response regulator transcription factor [Arachidicoccus sp.]|nr:response regulator transcription factor [Arachidicoccus sp.]
MDKINIAIVEDHQIVMEGLMMLLEKEPFIHIAGGFTDVDSFVADFKNLNLDIAIVDIMLGDKNGLDLCREIKKERPQINVIILSNMMEGSIVLQAIKNGASGYLIKNTSSDKLLQAINAVRSGEMYFSQEITKILAKVSTGTLSGIPSLTKRESEILQLISKGHTTPKIANLLFISPFTVETHRRNLMQKFNVRNMVELVMVAKENSFL